MSDLCRSLLSTKKRDILLTLQEGGKSLQELCIYTGGTSTSTLNNLKGLIYWHLVERVGRGKYELTVTGNAMVKQLTDFLTITENLEEHREFWLSHKADAIPEPLLEKLLALPDLNLVTSKVDPFDIEEFIVDIFCSAEAVD